ncbi:MAG TPA: hypothetical protein VD997_14725 [Phycisphaerales bacterium]|nr:hypothetical protein [Phycisphaerales bacterium]
MLRPSFTTSATNRWGFKLARVGVCLFAGAVVTWGVAWGCALWFASGSKVQYNQRWARMVNNVPVIGRLSAAITAGPGYQCWTLLSPAEAGTIIPPTADPVHVEFWMLPHNPGDVITQSLRVGMPCYAMYTHGPASSALAYDDPRGIDMWEGELPTRLLPLGFTLNTLLYAGVTLGLVEGVAFTRRRRRRNKGRCPSCGYDRGGIAVDAACPECGGKA